MGAEGQERARHMPGIRDQVHRGLFDQTERAVGTLTPEQPQRPIRVLPSVAGAGLQQNTLGLDTGIAQRLGDHLRLGLRASSTRRDAAGGQRFEVRILFQ